MTEQKPIWVFDNFEVGQLLGQLSITLDQERLDNWLAIYGAPHRPDRAPSGLLVTAMMEAYLGAIKPRPPGNVHASQKLKFSKPVVVGARLDAEVRCLWKEKRKERGWVGFDVILRCDGQEVLSGEITSIWAK